MLKEILHRLSKAFLVAVFAFVFLVFSLFFARSFAALPTSREGRKQNSLQHLAGLRKSLRQDDGARNMQEIFPEGACFTLTLYGLAWANTARQFPEDAQLQASAVAEGLWVLERLDREYVTEPFCETDVRNGVFWLGQKNLLTAQLLEIIKPNERPKAVVEEFHRNSRELAAAFLASPTKHIDSYPSMCWPADNVTALVSLLIHDDLYGTDFGEAYRQWKRWTQENCDQASKLPAGRIGQTNGQLHQPARGCANSWILGLLADRDPEFARQMYLRTRKHFLITRLGFRMFREYPEDIDIQADIDSGPIILGAGVTATGVGLGAARANGDLDTAQDIHALVNMWGMPGTVSDGDQEGKRYLLGMLPTGDAFLAWGYSLPLPRELLTEAPGLGSRLRRRATFLIATAVVYAILFLLGYVLYRSMCGLSRPR